MSTYKITSLSALPKDHTERAKKPRVYVWPTNESVMANFINRRSRPVQEWKPVVERALRERGLRFEKLVWSQYAGCSCPCSPGFIVHGADPTQSDVNIHITVATIDQLPMGKVMASLIRLIKAGDELKRWFKERDIAPNELRAELVRRGVSYKWLHRVGVAQALYELDPVISQ